MSDVELTKLRLIRSGRRSLAVDGKPLRVTFAGGTFIAMADGVVMFADIDGNETDLSPQDVRDLASAIQSIARGVDRFQVRISGQLNYRPTWDGPILWIEHLGRKRRFRATVKRQSRYPRRCESCSQPFSPGQRAYVDAGDQPKGDSFNGLLCESCCQPPMPGLRRVK